MRFARSSGFTLIELLIAVAVFAVLSALAYGGLNNVLLTAGHTQAETKRLTTLQLAMLYLERDIDQVIDRSVLDQYGGRRHALVSAEPSVEQPLIAFTRTGWANPAGQLRSQLERVAYDFDEKKENLVRITWPLLDGADEETAIRATLLNDVTALKFTFMDEQGQWRQTWPPLGLPPTASQLPKAIEVTVTARPWGELRRILPLPR